VVAGAMSIGVEKQLSLGFMSSYSKFQLFKVVKTFTGGRNPPWR